MERYNRCLAERFCRGNEKGLSDLCRGTFSRLLPSFMPRGKKPAKAKISETIRRVIWIRPWWWKENGLGIRSDLNEWSVFDTVGTIFGETMNELDERLLRVFRKLSVEVGKTNLYLVMRMILKHFCHVIVL
ncbi:hypothetical protein ACFE04_007788 [Oxalis oulophora]